MSGGETVIFRAFYSSAITQGLKCRDRRTNEHCFHPKNYPASSTEDEGGKKRDMEGKIQKDTHPRGCGEYQQVISFIEIMAAASIQRRSRVCLRDFRQLHKQKG